MSQEQSLEDYSPYFDDEKPLRQIHGLIAEDRDTDDDDNTHGIAVFKCDGGFLVVETRRSYYGSPDDFTQQSACRTRREVRHAVPRNFKHVLVECIEREWKPKDVAYKCDWMSDTTASCLHIWDYGDPLCRNESVKFVDFGLWSKVKKVLLKDTPKCPKCERKLPLLSDDRRDEHEEEPAPCSEPEMWKPGRGSGPA